MNKNIFITGISSWIGNFLGKELFKNHTIYGLSRNKSHLEVQEFLWDVNDENFLKEIYKNIPQIDWLILNAWVGYFDKFKNISLEEHKEIIHTNLLSPILLTSIFLDKIQSWIIFIGSISSKKSGKYGASYSASKFWLRGFAMNLKNEVKLNIHIINPKVVKTNFHKNSHIEIQGKFQETDIWNILNSVNEIIDWKEKRFEIDL